MKQKKKLIVCFALLSLIGCSEKIERVTNVEKFSQVTKIAPEKKAIHEVIKPVDIVVSEDFIIIQNANISNQDQFYVFDADTYKFLYSFIRKGNGPKEFLAPDMVQNPCGNVVKIVDQATRKVCDYRLTADSAIFVSENHLVIPPSKGPLQEVYLHNDSIIVYNTSDNVISTYNLKTDSVIDNFSFRSGLKEQMGAKYNQSYESFHLGYCNGDICVGFNYSNLLVHGNIDNNKIIMDKKDLELDIPTSILNSRFYYTYISMSSNLVIAQYGGYSFKELQPFPVNMGKRNFNLWLEVYNSAMQPMGLYDLTNDVLRCKIDEKRKRIYTWNPLKDFDDLLVYELPEAQ